MKWTIMGTGWISDSFAQSLLNNKQEIVAVISRTQTSGQIFADKYQIKNVFTSLEQDNLSEVVYIGTPNKIHYQNAFDALNLNKHVMVEKPMTHELAKTQKLFDLAQNKNLKIMEAYAHITQDFYQQKFDVKQEIALNYLQLSSKIKNDTYKQASSFSREMFGGVISDLGVYPLSVCVLINSEVSKIELRNVKYLNNVIVSCEITLKHKNKKTSYIKLSKLEDGDNALYIDKKKVLEHMSFGHINNRLDKEISVFVNATKKELSHYKNISLQVASLVEQIHQKIY